MYLSTKTYGHEVGISCAFRQWKADSHCRFLHGYALSFTFEFKANELDDRNWVVDFGSLKELKKTLEAHFDHKTVIAEDDPLLHEFIRMGELGALELNILPKVGCEAFAQHAYGIAQHWLKQNALDGRVALHKVTVAEHGANTASYIG